MERYARPVRAGRLNSQQKLAAEGSCKLLETSKVESKQKLALEWSCKPEKVSKAELTMRQTRQSTSRKALADLTNKGLSYQERSARARFNEQLEEPAANLLESFKCVVLDSVSNRTRGRRSRSHVVSPREDIGKKNHKGRVKAGIEDYRHSPVPEKLDVMLESITQLGLTKNDGDNCNLKVSAIKMRRMERLDRGTKEKSLNNDAVELQSAREARRSKQPDNKTSISAVNTIKKRKPWNAGQYEGKCSVKVFGSDLKKGLINSFHQSIRPKRRKDFLKYSQVAVPEGLHRVSYRRAEVEGEKGLDSTIPKKLNMEENSKIVEKKPNTESNFVEAHKVSVRRNNERAARKVINYSECFDDFIIHKRSTESIIKSDCRSGGNALYKAAQQTGTKRVCKNSDILHTECRKVGELEITCIEKIEHKEVSATPVGSTEQVLEKYCEGQHMRMAPKQVPARRTARLPPKYGERSNTGLSHGMGCDPNRTLRKSNPLANDSRKESPAIHRNQNLSSDTAALSEGVGGMGSEILSSMKLEVKCVDQSIQRGPKRGRKVPTDNNLESDCQSVGNALHETAQQMSTKRVKRDFDISHTQRRKVGELEITGLERTEHKEVTATPVSSADQAIENYCGGHNMRIASKQVPERKAVRLPPIYGQRSNTGLSHDLVCDLPSGTMRKGHSSANNNRKESPPIYRKRNLSSDIIAFGDGVRATGFENLSNMKLEVKYMDQNIQGSSTRDRKAPIDNNLELFTSAANVDVVDDMVPECFPVILNDLSKILAEVPLEHQSSFDESQEGIEGATPDDTQVIISGLNVKRVSIASFEDADLPSKVMDCCKRLGKPTLLQAFALPLLLAGHDIFCVSGPSSGQLYAHGIPAMVHMLTKKKSFSRTRPSPLCLVLTPSSELVEQITQAFEETFGFLRLKIANLIDTDFIKAEKNVLKPGKAILITTPESLQNALASGRCSLSNVSFLVLDRADTMLHCGSESAIQNILSQTPSSRQTAIFASMWLPELEQLLKDAELESNFVKIDVQDTGDITVCTGKQVVSQTIEVLEETARDARLAALVQTYQKKQSNRVLVFALYKEEALHIQGLLHQRGWKVAVVHGGMLDSHQTHALLSFKSGSCLILVATDVAARRLEIPCVDYIINYSFPYTLDDYVFRMNQTGKTGRSGMVHTFFTPADQAHSQELIELLRESEQIVPEELLSMASPAFITRAR